MFLAPRIFRSTLQPLPRLFQTYTTTASALSGKRALVTGGSRGIGLAISQAFAAAGASVVLVARDAERLAAAQKTLVCGSHRVIAGDIGVAEFWDDIRKQEVGSIHSLIVLIPGGLIQKNVCKKKNIDILVNAAGVTHYSLLMATDARVIEDVVRTNLVGCIYGCKAVLKNMIRQKGGTIPKPMSIGHLPIIDTARLHHQHLLRYGPQRRERICRLCGQ